MAGHEVPNRIAELPPLQVVGAPQGQHHLATLVELVALGMATKVIVVIQQQNPGVVAEAFAVILGGGQT